MFDWLYHKGTMKLVNLEHDVISSSGMKNLLILFINIDIYFVNFRINCENLSSAECIFDIKAPGIILDLCSSTVS